MGAKTLIRRPSGGRPRTRPAPLPLAHIPRLVRRSLAPQPYLDRPNRVRAVTLGIGEQFPGHVPVALDDVVVMDFRRAWKQMGAFQRAMGTRRLMHVGQQTPVLNLVEHNRDDEEDRGL